MERVSESYAFSASYQAGFLYGQAEEIVYPGKETKAPLLSQLLWDIKPVYYTGLLLDFARINPLENPGFVSDLSLKFGFPGSSGIMENRDWLSYENDGLTNFSSHENITKEVFLLDFAFGYSIPVKRTLILAAFINLSYMRYRFSSENGYLIYARPNPLSPLYPNAYYPIDDNPTRLPYSGKAINYTQEWLNAAPGISAGIHFLKYFFVELSFQVSPLNVCIDLDEHLHPQKRLQFRDYLWGGMLYEPQAFVSFSIREWLELSMEFSWRYISGIRGKTYQRPLPNASSDTPASNYAQNGTAGAGLSLMDTGLCLKIRL